MTVDIRKEGTKYANQFIINGRDCKAFAIMLMGYAVVKAGLMKSSESKSISVDMVYLVIPCVIIDAFQVDYTSDVKKEIMFRQY